MEENEDPTERAQEEIHHHAHEARERWISWVALSSALIAALAAVCSLLAGHYANDGMIDRMVASDQWAYYQAKGIELRALEEKRDDLEAGGKTLPPEKAKRMHDYEAKREKAREIATEKQDESEASMARHVILARGVTMFQIAIAVAAISVLTRRTRFWYVGLGFAVVGVFFLLQGSFFPHLFGGAPVAAHGPA